MSFQSLGISFSFLQGHELLRNIDLQLNRGDKIALSGPNGSGKTTLLKLFAGQLEPAQGALIAQHAALWVGQHIATKQNSGGEARLVELRAAFASNPSVLLLDEPSNDLDPTAKAWLLHELQIFSGAVLMVTHDPEILDRVDAIWELRNGEIQKHPPGFAAYVERLDAEETRLREQIASLEHQARRRDADASLAVESQQKRMERGRKAGVKSNLPKIIRGAKKRQAENTLARTATVHDDRRDSARRQVEDAQKRLRQISLFKWDQSPTRPHEHKRLLQVNDAMFGGKALNYEMLGAKRIHLKGRNGSGKSTLLQALCGDRDAAQRLGGDFYLAKAHWLFDQGLTRFTSNESLWRWFQVASQLETSQARTRLGRLGFEQDEQERPVRALSGGERVRIEIALALHATQTPQILLLDEPTNHLDIESRRILQRFVEDFSGGLVVVSHDATFLSALQFDEVIDLDTL